MSHYLPDLADLYGTGIVEFHTGEQVRTALLTGNNPAILDRLLDTKHIFTHITRADTITRESILELALRGPIRMLEYVAFSKWYSYETANAALSRIETVEQVRVLFSYMPFVRLLSITHLLQAINKWALKTTYSKNHYCGMVAAAVTLSGCQPRKAWRAAPLEDNNRVLDIFCQLHQWCPACLDAMYPADYILEWPLNPEYAKIIVSYSPMAKARDFYYPMFSEATKHLPKMKSTEFIMAYFQCQNPADKALLLPFKPKVLTSGDIMVIHRMHRSSIVADLMELSVPTNFNDLLQVLGHMDMRVLIAYNHNLILDLPKDKQLCDHIQNMPELFLVNEPEAILYPYNPDRLHKTCPALVYLKSFNHKLQTRFIDRTRVIDWLLPAASTLVFTTPGMLNLARNHCTPDKHPEICEIGRRTLVFIKKGVSLALLRGLYSPESYLYGLNPRIIKFIVDLFMNKKTAQIF